MAQITSECGLRNWITTVLITHRLHPDHPGHTVVNGVQFSLCVWCVCTMLDVCGVLLFSQICDL